MTYEVTVERRTRMVVEIDAASLEEAFNRVCDARAGVILWENQSEYSPISAKEKP